jgi:CRP/FNR family transcriptional regulator, cyclic AMP receptor protein
MNSDAIFQMLKEVDLLSLLPDDVLTDLASECEIKEVKADDILFAEGSQGDCMYFILSGEFLIYVKNKIIATRKAGEYIGEMALIETKPRSASAKAVVNSCFLEMERSQFEKFLTPHKEVVFDLLKTLSNRSRTDLKTLDQDNEELKFQKKSVKRLKHIVEFTYKMLQGFHSNN